MKKQTSCNSNLYSKNRFKKYTRRRGLCSLCCLFTWM